MSKKTELETLALKKHTISRLNEEEMSNFLGGNADSSAGCIGASAGIVGSLIAATAWAYPSTPDKPYTQNISDKLIWTKDDIQSCLYPEVTIRAQG